MNGSVTELQENIEVGNGLRECMKGLEKHLAFLPCQSIWFGHRIAEYLKCEISQVNR